MATNQYQNLLTQTKLIYFSEMRMAIIGFSLYILVTEPRNTLYFKIFIFWLRIIERTLFTIQLYALVNSLNASLKNIKNGGE